MGVCEGAVRSDEERALGGLPGLDIEHALHMSIRDPGAWSIISDRISTLGGASLGARLSQLDEGVDVRCRIRGVSERAVRALVAALLDEDLAQRASVEHLVLPKRAEVA